MIYSSKCQDSQLISIANWDPQGLKLLDESPPFLQGLPDVLNRLLQHNAL